MGKGGAKGKKGNGASSSDDGPSQICVSEEVQPRHYVYVGKVPADTTVDPTITKGKHAKGSKGASTGDAGKGKGKPSGKVAGKGKEPQGGKPSGFPPQVAKGMGIARPPHPSDATSTP